MKGRLAATALVIAIALAGCAAPRPNTITIHDLRFDPQTLTVAKGTTVMWINNDQAAHTIVTDDLGVAGKPQAGQFGSVPLSPGDTLKHTFDAVGTFPYHCTIHPYIKGTVIVR